MKAKIVSIVVVSYVTLTGGAMGFVILFLLFNPPFLTAIVPFYASIALIVIFIFYESRGLINLWLGLGNPDANLSDKDFEEAQEHLEQDSKKIYNAPPDTVVKFIDDEMRDYADDLGYANLNDRFGHYQELSGLLTRVKWQIENARQSGDQGDAMRRNIAEGADFKDLLNYFDELRSSIIAIGKSIAKKEVAARDLSVRWWIGVSLTVIALVTVVLSVQSTLS